MQNELPKFEDGEAVRAWSQGLKDMDWSPDDGHILEMVLAISVESSVVGHHYTGKEGVQEAFNTLIMAVNDLALDPDNIDAMEFVDAAIENIPQEGTDMLNFAINRFRRGYEKALNTLDPAPEHNM